MATVQAMQFILFTVWDKFEEHCADQIRDFFVELTVSVFVGELGVFVLIWPTLPQWNKI